MNESTERLMSSSARCGLEIHHEYPLRRPAVTDRAHQRINVRPQRGNVADKSGDVRFIPARQILHDAL